MLQTDCLALADAWQAGRLVRDNGLYRLPSQFAAGSRRLQNQPAG
ncbi:MAG: hypothetical protein ACE15E_22330 [Acidobacteriota bacterium]